MGTKCPSWASTVTNLHVLLYSTKIFTTMYNSEIIRFCSLSPNPYITEIPIPIFFHTTKLLCPLRKVPLKQIFNEVLSSPICICCLKHIVFLFLKVWNFLLCRIKSCYAQSINTWESFLEDFLRVPFVLFVYSFIWSWGQTGGSTWCLQACLERLQGLRMGSRWAQAHLQVFWRVVRTWFDAHWFSGHHVDYRIKERYCMLLIPSLLGRSIIC